MSTSNVNDTAGTMQGSAPPAVSGPLCQAHDLKEMLGQLASQVADADRRHSHALATMQERLGALGAAAQGLRGQLPQELTPVLDRIEGGMAQLSDRLAETDAQRRAQTASEPAPALRSALAGDALETFSRRATASRVAGSAAIDNFDVVDSASNARDEAAWDKEAAEALASLYEAEKAPGGDAEASTPLLVDAGPDGLAIDTALAPLAPATTADAAATVPAEPMALAAVALPPAPDKPAVANPAAIALEVAALQSKALEGERQWLDQRLGDIAGRLERSFAGKDKADPLEALDLRFNLLESKLAEAMGGNAKSADLAGLKSIESHVEDLTAQLVSVQTHFSRLDTIELELRSLAERMSVEGIARIIADASPPETDNEALAGAVASRVVKEMPRFEQTLQTIASQLSADRIAGLIAQSKPSSPDAGTIARLVADHVSERMPQASQAEASTLPQLEELRSMIQSLADERRHGEEQTSTMLDTMQQAMIRLLDRMEAIEQAQIAEPLQQADLQPSYPEPHRAGVGLPELGAAAVHAGPAHDTRVMPGAAPIPVPVDHFAAEAPRGYDSPAAAATDLRADAQSEAPKPGSREDFVAAARRAARIAAETPAGDEPAAEPQKSRSKQAKSLIGGRPVSRAAMAMACLVLVGASYFVMKSTLLRSPQQPPQQTQPTTQPTTQSRATGNDATAVKRNPAEQKLQNLEDADQLPDDGSRSLQRRSETMGHGGGSAQAFDGALAKAVPASQVQALPGFPPTIPTALSPEPGAPGASSKAALPLTVGPNSLRNAATKGDPSAEFEIGARFAEGRGVTQDLQQAVAWYTRSAAQGFGPAQYRLGSMYERGLGVKPDLARARIWYSRAAEQGIVKAMHNLAVLGAGRDASAADYVEAAKWFQAAADHGLTDSQFNLAIMHDSGLGMERDAKLALKWFSLAARAGDEEAARRREALKQKLLPAEIAQIEAEVATWRPKQADLNINDPRVAGEAWKARAR